jgi:5-methylcytosine-specific restriction endonuclease McrA
MDRFSVEVSDEEIGRERAKARELRKSAWWKRRLGEGVCHYCRRHFKPSELTMDHIVPIIRGGRSVKGNVAAVCKDCNSRKKYLLPLEWEEYLARLAGDEEE